MTSSELDNRNIALSMRKSVENLVISSQDAIGQSISQALTFSGVISHHTHQILQENRSVSRSPSPSLRITDTSAGAGGGASELFDNDKSCESLSGAGAGAGGGDNVSVSSAELPGVTLRSDIPKFQTQISTKSSDGSAAGGARVKKKSWYNSLYPTYKSKSDDFKRLFKDLPDDERLIVDYSCALQKDILAHGRLYASQNYMCFYANIFGWETNMTLRWKDVTHITKEKTALVIPNAILVCTENEKHFLTSFSGRDKAYLMLFRVWQNALMDQPMSSQEIWQWVHSCYGDELGFNSDDEEYSKDAVEDISLQPIDISEELVEAVSCAEAGGEPRDEPRAPRSSSQPRDSSPPLVQSNGNGGFGEEAADALPTDMSDTSDSEPDNKHNGGECEKCTNPHDGKLILQAQFAFNIDQMFTMIFTNSKFNLELLAARGSSDYVQSPWQAQNGLKCRQISYTLGLTSGPIGPKEVHITETQVMNKCSKAGALYSIDCTSDNTGIPYADYFSVCAHYCLQRVTHSSTMLSFFGAVKYKKNMWPMVKTFLEKNSISGVEDFARLLESRLHAEADTAVPAARKSRRHRRLTASSVEASPSPAPRPPPVFPSPRAAPPRATPSSTRWLLAIVVVLLTINALLYWRLTHQHPPTQDFNDLQNRLSSIQSVQTAEWSRLLERHSARQRDQMARWREALHTTVQHLAQTERTLTKLLETIKPSLESAQRDADARAHGDDL